MDRALAGSHGAPYVHLAVFAIDVDRVRERIEDGADDLPFGWEVFLTEVYLLAHVQPAEPAGRALLDDVVLGIFDGPDGRLGAQLVFAAWDAVARGAWPTELRRLFSSWRSRPDELVRALAPLWKDEARLTAELARRCLECPIDPPLAPPTLEALAALAPSPPARP